VSCSDVFIRDVYITNTTYTSLTYDGNVLASPGWVWDNKYKSNLTQRFYIGSSYSVKGHVTAVLSDDCFPQVYVATTTLSFSVS
jgi:hypothetical protein